MTIEVVSEDFTEQKLCPYRKKECIKHLCAAYEQITVTTISPNPLTEKTCHALKIKYYK